MPVSGRHDAEVVERVLVPAQKGIALLVAREIEIRVQTGTRWHARSSRPETELVDDELTGCSGLTCPFFFLRIAAEPRETVGSPRDRRPREPPVKIWSSTRAGAKRISPSAAAFQIPIRERIDVGGLSTKRAQASCRSRFSSRIFNEYGRRAI